MTLSFQVQLKIRKPVAQVFDAVVDPARMSGYFIQRGSGPLAAGSTVTWRFPELDDQFTVIVHEVVKNERIVLEWGSAAGGANTRVEMTFKPMDASNTMVQIAESGWTNDEAGLKASHGNAAGWMHMMMGLKGYLEYGINLRAGGAF